MDHDGNLFYLRLYYKIISVIKFDDAYTQLTSTIGTTHIHKSFKLFEVHKKTNLSEMSYSYSSTTISKLKSKRQ